MALSSWIGAAPGHTVGGELVRAAGDCLSGLGVREVEHLAGKDLRDELGEWVCTTKTPLFEVAACQPPPPPNHTTAVRSLFAGVGRRDGGEVVCMGVEEAYPIPAPLAAQGGALGRALPYRDCRLVDRICIAFQTTSKKSDIMNSSHDVIFLRHISWANSI